MDDSEGKAVPVPTGLPVQPEGEKLLDMPALAALAGEESRAALDPDLPLRRTPVQTGTGTPLPPESVELGEGSSITRASSRIKLDLPPVYLSKEDKQARKVNPEFKRLSDLLYTTQRMCATTANVCTRDLWRRDSDVLDANGGRPPRPWLMPKPGGLIASTYLYQVTGRVAPELPGAMRSVLSKRVADNWKKTRFDALVRQNRSPAHYKDTIPIPLRAADVHIFLSDGNYKLNFALRSGAGQRLSVSLHVRDSHQKTILDNIQSGEWRQGEVALMRDRKNKWHARIAYKRLAQHTTGIKAAAINRGLRWFLAAVADDGLTWRYPGADIIAYLKQIQARRRQYQNDVTASGRVGHGRKRTLRPIKRLEEKAYNWRRTKCQTIARRFVKWLVEHQIGLLYVEDFTGIRDGEPISSRIEQLKQEWPFYDLESRIVSCCEENGIEVQFVPAEYISQICPRCGHKDAGNKDLRHWLLCCTKCDWKQHLDLAAAKNVLVRGQGHREQPGDAPISPTESQGNPPAEQPDTKGARKSNGKRPQSRGKRGTGRKR